MRDAERFAVSARDLISAWDRYPSCITEIYDTLSEVFGPPRVDRMAVGWPWPAMERRVVQGVDPRTLNRHCRSSIRYFAPEKFGVYRLQLSLGTWTFEADLPVKPAWAGLGADTLVHGVMLWTLLWGTGALRHSVRRRRGLCPTCAYPMGSSALCPECGCATRGTRPR